MSTVKEQDVTLTSHAVRAFQRMPWPGLSGGVGHDVVQVEYYGYPGQPSGLLRAETLTDQVPPVLWMDGLDVSRGVASTITARSLSCRGLGGHDIEYHLGTEPSTQGPLGPGPARRKARPGL